MDCRTAEGMVSSYIEHKLPVNELEEFLDHVESCSSCYDELETYFIVHEVTQQLDDSSSNSVLDFKNLLEQDIRKSRRYIRKKEAELVSAWSEYMSPDHSSGGNSCLCNDGNGAYFIRYWRNL